MRKPRLFSKRHWNLSESNKYWGIWVVLPEPVSPTTTIIRFSTKRSIIFSLYANTGKSSGAVARGAPRVEATFSSSASLSADLPRDLDDLDLDLDRDLLRSPLPSRAIAWFTNIDVLQLMAFVHRFQKNPMTKALAAKYVCWHLLIKCYIYIYILHWVEAVWKETLLALFNLHHRPCNSHEAQMLLKDLSPEMCIAA